MKHLHLLFLAALTTLLAASCSQPKDRFRLEGSIENIRQAEFYVYCDDGTFDAIDTIRIDGGKFAYERRLTAPTVLTLLYPNFSQTYIVAEPGKTVTMKGDASKLGEADISGTEENELLTTFRRQNADKPEGNARLAATEFIRSHKTTLAAVAVFKRYFATAQEPDAATTLSLLGDLRKAQPGNATLTATDQRMRPYLSTARGRNLPDFSLTTIEGRTVKKADFSGRPLVVVFWATWGSDARTWPATLQRIKEAYGHRVGVILCSLDIDKAACRQRVETDSLTCPVVCDGLGLDSPTARLFGLHYVPGCLLVDAAGQVVARDLKPAELEQRLAQLSK